MNELSNAVVVAEQPAQQTESSTGEGAGHYNVAMAYLRAFITVLVVAHHAVLAYHPYAPLPSPNFASQPLLWTAFPIVDSRKFPGTDLFVGFNDIFFMSLMFFISGLFVWPGLVRKGAGHFVRDRILRLGIPFLVAAGVLAPLAYYPAYYVTGADPGLAAFWKQWLSLGTWPAGPAWFIWLLLAFGCVATILYHLAPRWGEVLGRVTSAAGCRPIVFYALLVVLSAAAYLPMALAFDPARWINFGPISVQISRLLHYVVYFSLGIGVGACGIDRGLLAPDGRLARRWPLWSVASLALFGLAIVAFLAYVGAMMKGPVSRGFVTLLNSTFVLSCAASAFAFLALFVRFARKRAAVFDSLSQNAYGIYLVHYVCVTWLQLALLGAAMSGAAKGVIVFAGTLILSWGVTAILRRIPAVGRII